MREGTEAGRDLRSASLHAGGALLCLVTFWGVSLRYVGFRIPYGVGVQEIHPAELVFSLWYLVLGIPAVWLGARALDATSLPERAVSALTRLGSLPRVVLAGGLAAGLAALAIRAWVLQFAPIADDESTYAFIARTLLEGRVVNPSPGDVDFFRNQFVILDDTAWYGKYPIGHPLLLAAGEALGLRALVAPALTAASLMLTFAVGRRVLPPHLALLGTGLLLISPQFIFTGGTELSQTTSGLCLLVALLGLLRLDAGGSLRFAALAGVALGFGLLVRPLPGSLFLAVAGLWVLMRFRDEPASRQIRRIAVGLAPVVVFAALFLVIQTVQTGDPTKSGYDVYHSDTFGGLFRAEWIAASVSSALLRQNLWLFGWPLSFLFLPFARRRGPAALLWAMIGAEYAYRVILPKTVVASTGPIYVAEIVPLLALLSASGMAGAVRLLASLGIARAQPRVVAAVLAGFVVAGSAFLPVQVRDLRRSSSTWQTAQHLLDDAGAERALIFADGMVDLAQARSWSYYPPNPSPRLDDPRIFVRIPRGEDAAERAREFWQRRFPDRTAWVFGWNAGQPVLQPLSASPPVAGGTTPPPRG